MLGREVELSRCFVCAPSARNQVELRSTSRCLYSCHLLRLGNGKGLGWGWDVNNDEKVAADDDVAINDEKVAVGGKADVADDGAVDDDDDNFQALRTVLDLPLLEDKLKSVDRLEGVVKA